MHGAAWSNPSRQGHHTWLHHPAVLDGMDSSVLGLPFKSFLDHFQVPLAAIHRLLIALSIQIVRSAHGHATDVVLRETLTLSPALCHHLCSHNAPYLPTLLYRLPFINVTTLPESLPSQVSRSPRVLLNPLLCGFFESDSDRIVNTHM